MIQEKLVWMRMALNNGISVLLVIKRDLAGQMFIKGTMELGMVINRIT